MKLTLLLLHSLSLPNLVINQDCTVVDSLIFPFPSSGLSNEEWCLHFFTSTSPRLLNTRASPFDKQPAPGRKCHRWQMWPWSLASTRLALWHFSIYHHQSFLVKGFFCLVVVATCFSLCIMSYLYMDWLEVVLAKRTRKNRLLSNGPRFCIAD